MDGLMFDTESVFTDVQTKMFADRGFVFSLDIKSKLMGKKSTEIVPTINEILGTSFDPEGWMKEQDEQIIKACKTQVVPFPGLFELLDVLDEKGVKKAIGTSAREGRVNLLLEKFNVRHRFDVIVTGDMIAKGKPDPEIYLKVLENLGVNGNETIVLEDAQNGITSAYRAGCLPIAIPNEYTRHNPFLEAVLVADSFMDERLLKMITA